ncbi:MAG: hypothetical protein IT371_26325 [Deltaproteobacteria bacterium]|nr:hypothetical protein [Deltaproteobacteria bacterium]
MADDSRHCRPRPSAASRAAGLLAAAGLAWAVGSGCAAGPARGPQDALRRYVNAIRDDQPQAAYALLDENTRRLMTQNEFTARWKTLRPELLTQASQVRARVDQPFPITAKLNYPGGTRAQLRFAEGAWRIDGGVSVALQSGSPAEALKAFVRAVEQRSYEAVMKLLARSVRESVERDINERLTKLKEAMKGEIEVNGDRARLQYDPRYKVELVNEDGQWRIADFD